MTIKTRTQLLAELAGFTQFISANERNFLIDLINRTSGGSGGGLFAVNKVSDLSNANLVPQTTTVDAPVVVWVSTVAEFYALEVDPIRIASLGPANSTSYPEVIASSVSPNLFVAYPEIGLRQQDYFQDSVNGDDGNIGMLPYSADTTIAVASNGLALPQATINVVSTQDFPTSGTITVTTSAGDQTVTYTGKTSTSFTGTSGGIGTMSTGGAVTAVGQAGVNGPVKTIKQALRRVSRARGRIEIAMRLHLQGVPGTNGIDTITEDTFWDVDIAESLNRDDFNLGASLSVYGHRTVLATGTLTSVVPYDSTATNADTVPNGVVTGVPAGYQNRKIVLTSGPKAGAVATILEYLPGNLARYSSFFTILPPFDIIDPDGDETFEIYDVTVVDGEWRSSSEQGLIWFDVNQKTTFDPARDPNGIVLESQFPQFIWSTIQGSATTSNFIGSGCWHTFFYGTHFMLQSRIDVQSNTFLESCSFYSDGVNFAGFVNVQDAVFDSIFGLNLHYAEPGAWNGSFLSPIRVDTNARGRIRGSQVTGVFNWSTMLDVARQAAADVSPGQALTSIAVASDGQSLPQATINVASTALFPPSGTITVVTTAGNQAVTYTGITSTSFTGAAGGAGVMNTGNLVTADITAFFGVNIVDGGIEVDTKGSVFIFATSPAPVITSPALAANLQVDLASGVGGSTTTFTAPALDAATLASYLLAEGV